MRYLLLIAVLFFSGCITIKYLPPPCKKDTVYIEKEPIYKSMPMWPNPQYIDIDTLLLRDYGVDTSQFFDQFRLFSDSNFIKWNNRNKIDTAKIIRYPLIERNCNADTFYKGVAMKAQQITNVKR